MSPLNREFLLGARPVSAFRAPPTGMLPLPPPRFRGRLVPPGMPIAPPMINPVFGVSMRQRLPPPPRPAGVSRPNGLLPLFPGPRVRGMALAIMPPMRPRGVGALRGPLMPRRIPPPEMMPPQMIPPMIRPMRPRFATGNGNVKGKTTNSTKKVKLEELELKKPWMTDEIRSEIQKKNKLYAKAKKNKDAVEWEEFKDLRNKVTRMIRDAKNEYLTKHPEQGQKTDDNSTVESEGVQKTDNSTELSELTEETEETQPSSEQAHLYPDDEEPYDQRDENYISSEDDTSYYCEICDRDFPIEDAFVEHKNTHKICGLDGCTFSAHPLLVEKHIKMQHSTGLYQRMKNLSTPEDIKKWLTERKRKYPTKANIELRKAEELEKSQRGEVIKQDLDIKAKTKKTMNVREKRRNPRKRHTREAKNYIHVDDMYRGLRPFPGTGILQQKDSNEICLDKNEKVRQTDQHEEIAGNISDEDYVEQACTVLKSTNLSIPSLVANYESGTDEDEAPEEIPIKRVKMEDIGGCKTAENNAVCKETSNVQSHADGNDQSNKQTNINKISRCPIIKRDKKHEINKIVKDKLNEKVLNRHYNKLLHKLLSRSIQHERNLICQCLKYIADNNFLD